MKAVVVLMDILSRLKDLHLKLFNMKHTVSAILVIVKLIGHFQTGFKDFSLDKTGHSLKPYFLSERSD